MTINTCLLSGTTNSSGALTVSATHAYFGKLYAVQLIDGTADNGVDITLTAEQGDFSIPLLSKANFDTDQMVYPRVAAALNTDGSALTWYDAPLVVGTPKMVIAQGGDTKVVSCILYICED